MVKGLTAGIILSLVFAASVFANDPVPAQKGQTPDFDQRKAEILKMLDQRIARLQEDKECVQSAKSHDELAACREKQRAQMEGMRGERGMRGGPGPQSPRPQ